MKKSIIFQLLLTLTLNLQFNGSAIASDEKIEDNSFLIEEAYNQERGVIQHIQSYQYNWLTGEANTWQYFFTQEWPVPDERNQLSFTMPVFQTYLDGVQKIGPGDFQLNYRHGFFQHSKTALAPRFSISFPTGNYRDGQSSNSVGFQINIPVSIELSKYFTMHINAGTLLTPKESDETGAKANTFDFNSGLSVIWICHPNFNFLTEFYWYSDSFVESDASRGRINILYLNPGIRAAINIGNLQIVPGVAAPIGIGPYSGNYGIFTYLSFEHKLW